MGSGAASPDIRGTISSEEAREPTLHDFFFPETLVYTLRSLSNELIAIPLRISQEMSPGFGIALPDESCASRPSFRPSEVTIREELSTGSPSQMPSKVALQDGAVLFFKLVRCGDKRMLRHELDSYKKIDTAVVDDSLRIPRLKGLVRDKSVLVFGLLLANVECRRVTLSCAVNSETPTSLGQKWATQLQDGVRQLRSAGIVWADAKPDNVLIDENQDVWIVDFGGGYTDGWVPSEIAGTTQGDLCALRKILEFIGE